MLIHRAILTLFILAHFVFLRLTMTLYYPVSCVFTHVASIYANLLEQKKAFTKELNYHRTGLGHKHGRRFIVLGHKYGHHDVK